MTRDRLARELEETRGHVETLTGKVKNHENRVLYKQVTDECLKGMKLTVPVLL